MLELQGSFIILSYIRTVLNIKSNKGKISYKGTSIRLSTDFLTETLQARREWHDIFKVMKREEPTIKNTLPSYVKFKNKIKLKQNKKKEYSTQQASFRFDGEIKSFPDKQNLKEFSTTKPVLQQMLKELL